MRARDFAKGYYTVCVYIGIAITICAKNIFERFYRASRNNQVFFAAIFRKICVKKLLTNLCEIDSLRTHCFVDNATAKTGHTNCITD